MKNSEASELGSKPPSNLIQYKRLRAPSEHGGTLQQPALSTAPAVWAENLSVDHSEIICQQFVFDKLVANGRAELLNAARKYSAIYRDVDFAERTSDQIVMSGHQPKLFHPGVWYKNFALANLGNEFSCTAINLVVDNDICGVAAIKVPAFKDTNSDDAVWKMLHMDSVGDNIPFEVRRIQDQKVFANFAIAVTQEIGPIVKSPLVNKFWSHAIEASQRDNRLGHAVASARHRFEQDLGLQTLEVPLSHVACTPSFATFMFEIVSRQTEFTEIYNSTLDAYRKTHKIRSRSHPVPALEEFETPFWVWDQRQPVRRRLFARLAGTDYVLFDGAGWEHRIKQANFVDQVIELNSSGIAIRPRALMTTMYSRLILSDLFLHGIGGAKYDQLTDAIMARFFGVTPPRFMTLSATLKLPSSQELVQPHDLSATRSKIRELSFHPEAYLEKTDETTRPIIDSKSEWIAKQLPRGERLERHKAIVEANSKLQPFLQSQRQELLERKEAQARRIRSSQIFGSRECSFALFPESLPDQLNEISRS